MSGERRRNEPVCADCKESRKYSDMRVGYVAATSEYRLDILLVYVSSYIIGNETRAVTSYALYKCAVMRACMFSRRFVAQVFAHVYLVGCKSRERDREKERERERESGRVPIEFPIRSN